MWVTDGLFEDGVHVVMFGSPQELRERVAYYLSHEGERRNIVEAAHRLTLRLHSWDARARFISAVIEKANRSHPIGQPWYSRPPSPPPSSPGAVAHVGCFSEPRKPRNHQNTSRAFATARADAALWEEQRAWPEGSAMANAAYSRGFNVSMCEQHCEGWPYFALICGGFCHGGDVSLANRLEPWAMAPSSTHCVRDGGRAQGRSLSQSARLFYQPLILPRRVDTQVHSRGRCACGRRAAWRRVARAPLSAGKCSGTCSLHDDRPCGGVQAMAVYNLSAR